MIIWHFLKLGYRNLKKNKSNTLINLFGLSLGIAILLVISIFLSNELSVDKFHVNSSNIYKVSRGEASVVPGPLSAFLKDNFPEIQDACHIETLQLLGLSPILSYNDEVIEIISYYATNADFFSLFDFKVVRGDVNKALGKPFAMILTESEAKRIFKDEDPIGQTIIWRSNQDFNFTVEAIVSDVPQNSSIQFNGLISEASTKIMTPYYPDNWGFAVYETYLLLNPEIQAKQFEEKLNGFLIDYYDKNLSSLSSGNIAREKPLILHSLKEAYFDQELAFDTTNRGNILLMRVLLVIGLLILFLSVINYANLSTAKASSRKKEIGVQKVHGSGKTWLIIQFLTETTILSFIAAIIGVIIAFSILPWFSQFMTLSQILRIEPGFLFLIFPCILFLGILAGIYPAFFLSSFKEMSILKASTRGRAKGKNIRHFLVVFQFFISMTLIAVTLLIDRQVSYIKDMDMGIDKTHVVYAKLPLPLFRGNKDVFTERISRLANVEEVAYSSRMFGAIDGYNTLEINGKLNKFTSMWVDAAFIDFYELELLEGRFFSDEHIADINATALLNEAAIREFDVEDPFEIEIRVPGGSAKVIGIVKDFNFKSLHHSIEPLAIIYLPGQGAYANIRMSGHNIPATLDEISEIWTELAPGFPFNYHFLDSSFDDLYQQDAKMGKAISLASMIAIIIAVLGVMSLSLFVCESRVKEIALRKINGAKIREVILGLNKGFVYYLIIAFVLASPLAWYMMRLWLDNFAYKTNITLWIFIVSGLIVSLVTLAIVSIQSWRFANRNPADSLRCE
jgi:putative ABC transport system permease protein